MADELSAAQAANGEDADTASTMEMPVEQSPALALTKHAAIHLLLWVLVFSLYAAADSWYLLTKLGLALLLSVVTGLLAGITTTTLVHEWFHLLGAWRSGGAYSIPAKPGLFVYDWKFADNTVGQFNIMSVAGSVGGAIALLLLWYALPVPNPGRAAVLAGAAASFAFAGAIEWPVLARTRHSRDPLAELSKITPPVLLRSLLVGVVVGGLVLLAYHPD